MSVLAALFGALGIAVTGAVTWLVAKRQTSGRIDTSSPDALWAEGKSLREEQRAEIVALRSEVLSMRNEAITIRIEAAQLREEAARTREEAAATRAEMVVLREEAKACGEEVAVLKALLVEARKGNV